MIPNGPKLQINKSTERVIIMTITMLIIVMIAIIMMTKFVCGPLKFKRCF